MPHEDDTPTVHHDVPTIHEDVSRESIERQSVLLTLDADERPTAGLRLIDLEDEEPLPELVQGAEKYSLIKELGVGGMGKVYLAYDQDLKRRVALKVVKLLDRKLTRRFLEEAQVMAQLQHPNIVPVYEVGLSKGKPYYTMPVVRGRTLSDVIKKLRAGDPKTTQQFSLARRMSVFVQLAQALAYAHGKGVVHRDLKPDNVMLGGHGEVQVMDWGLSKVVAKGAIAAGDRTGTGLVLGTPLYMSPEQARGDDNDTRSDIYTMGVMLYELLTLARPFSGSPTEVMAAHIRDEPVPPRQRAPELDIPLELDRVCRQAVRKDPAARFATADEMLADVVTWSEAEADKAKRRELADAKAKEGRAKLAEYHRVKCELVRLEAETEEVAGRFESWQPVAEKAALFAAEDRRKMLEHRLTETAAATVQTLTDGLAFDEEHAGAREGLADYYWDRYLDAEAQFNERGMRFYRGMTSEYHGGKYARELTGDGSLTLTTNTPGAEVWLSELVEEGPVLVERNERHLGVTPLAATPLAMGSYLVVLKKEGYRDTRYPVYISRNREWVGEVKLLTDAEVGDGFHYVPGGPCITGGDPEAANALPRAEPRVDGFLIAEHPVTMAEYIEFVNALASSEGLEAALSRAPRRVAEDWRSNYLVDDGQGRLTLPELDAEGDRPNPRHPALGISWHDAVAYCAWRSQRDGVEYRLLTEVEWEKAARGVDGRWFPWGWRFDPSLCNMQLSRKERTSPVAIDEFPSDVSVYGVRGLGGNIRDWTSTEVLQGTGPERRESRVDRGASWSNAARLCRAAYRSWLVPTNVDGSVGLRVAKSVSSTHPV